MRVPALLLIVVLAGCTSTGGTSDAQPSTTETQAAPDVAMEWIASIAQGSFVTTPHATIRTTGTLGDLMVPDGAREVWFNYSISGVPGLEYEVTMMPEGCPGCAEGGPTQDAQLQLHVDNTATGMWHYFLWNDDSTPATEYASIAGCYTIYVTVLAPLGTKMPDQPPQEWPFVCV